MPPAVTDSHATEPALVLGELATDESGLSDAVAAQRLIEYGPNSLAEAESRPMILRLLAQFDNVLIYVLIGAAVLKAILGDWIDFTVILAVAVISAVVGYVQEGKAESALAGIRSLLSATANVRRDGQWRVVDAATIVPGDIVRFAAGDRLPADVRLIETVNLRVEESALTGEAVPAAKQTAAVEAAAGIGDRTSMAYSSTIVAAGTGVGVVTATGSATEIGRIQELVSGVEQIDTPLTRRLDRFGTLLSLGILAMAAVIVVIGKVVHNLSISELISAAIGFAVASIPEGLPAVVTITLALGVQQMARRNAITRRLPAVEALGSVNVICSDKTGTLTQNEMTVRTAVTSAGVYDVGGTGYQPDGAVTRGGEPASLTDHLDLRALVRVMALCNDASVSQVDGHWQVAGEPTEGALRTFVMKAGYDAHTPRLAQLPFDSANKFMVTLNERPGGDRTLLVKGAPDRLLDRSNTQLGADGRIAPLDRGFWEGEIDRLSAQGLRVLAAAFRPAGDSQETVTADDVADGLTFVGLTGIVDPPRPEAVEAIALCHGAGIRVKMITGDHVGTARAIAREMGLVSDPGAPALTGADVQQMSQTRLREAVQDVDIYARTSPKHKLRIVSALQAQGNVTAMTGDGVNDAPALTRADVGVAMGIKGTDATKQAADIILADDNFATIERAVEEGRRVYDNIRKSILFLLPTNGGQSLVILVAILAGIALPLTPVQILWINLITGVTLSLALVFEPAEPGIMSRRPRPSDGPLISRPDLLLIGFVSALVAGSAIAVYFLTTAHGYSEAVAQTAAVTMLALGQLAYLFNCRFLESSSLTPAVLRGNPMVWWMSGAMVVLQLIFVYAPFMHTWFGSAPLAAIDWFAIAGIAVLMFLIIEAAKRLDLHVSAADDSE